MTDMDTRISLVDQTNNYTGLPDPIFNQIQAIASLINSAVEDQGLYEQGTSALETLHQQMLDMVQDFGAIVQAVTSERDEALDNLAVVEDERDNTRVILEELTNAVRWVDGDHPLVSNLIETVEEMNMEYADELATENLIDMLSNKTGQDWNKCWSAAQELTGWGGDPLSQETIELLTLFIEKVQAEQEEE